MDQEAQKSGERRVREHLIDPLFGLGLLRPSGMGAEQFDAMTAELCKKLAYMTPGNLAALVEQVASQPAGKDKNRWPIGAQVLAWAGTIQSPPDDASPFLRALFAHGIGQDAIAQGWGPELLAHARRVRRFPGAYEQSKIRDDAGRAMRRAQDLAALLDRGETLTSEEGEWLAARRAIEDRCRQIAALGRGGAA